jgi:hypothetical protein
MEMLNIKTEFSEWFHSNSTIVYKNWYNTTLLKKIDEIESSYYESFNEKIFDIDPDDIQNKINNIKDNTKNRYNVQNTAFAEYDRKNQNGKPKALLNNYYTKFLSIQFGGGENLKNSADDMSNNNSFQNDLRSIFLRDLYLIEEGLKLYEKDGVNGLNYQTNGKKIDILAIDKNNNYVIIELNYGKTYENIIGQLLRNKNWIQKNKAKPEQKVRGIIISNEIMEDLAMACINLPDIELFEYELSVKIKRKE